MWFFWVRMRFFFLKPLSYSRAMEKRLRPAHATTGAEAVVENGGIVNKIGTNGLTIIAKTYTTPVYVACESYKFSRIFPLSQTDIPLSQDALKCAQVNDAELKSKDFKSLSTCDVPVLNPLVDYTPPEFITFLLTDLGVFTPSAVSDELIKLHQ